MEVQSDDNADKSQSAEEGITMIGCRIEVRCTVQGISTLCLWDTGSQISLVSHSWLKEHLQNYTISPVMELISHHLTVEGVGQELIPYIGYAPLALKLGCESSTETVLVPFLVCEIEMKNPILGTNVMEHLIGGKTLEDKLMKISGFGLNGSQVNAMATRLKQEHEPSALTTVTTPREGEVLLLANARRISIACDIDAVYAERQSTVLFEPRPDWDLIFPHIKLHNSIIDLSEGENTKVTIYLTNNSGSEVRLDKQLVLGTLEEVQSVYECDIQFHEFDQDILEHKASVNLTTVDTDLTEKATVQDFASLTIDEISEENKQFFKTISELELPELTMQEAANMRTMLWQERAAFSQFPDDIGSVPDLQLHIETTDEIPVQKRYNAIPRPLYAEVKNHVQNMLDRGWITKSKSAWSSPVVITKKKSGGIRFCVDYRLVNKKTIQDKHPIPRIQEALDTLINSKFFTVMDLTRAYYQGFLTESSRCKTAFVTPWGFYQFTRIPFGLTNAVAAFQRYMEETLEEERMKYALPYLDDTIVHSESVATHIEHVRNVLRRFQAKGLKLNINKCDFCKLEAKYLGRIVSKDGYRMDERSVQSVRNLLDRECGRGETTSGSSLLPPPPHPGFFLHRQAINRPTTCGRNRRTR